MLQNNCSAFDTSSEHSIANNALKLCTLFMQNTALSGKNPFVIVFVHSITLHCLIMLELSHLLAQIWSS